MTTTAQDSKPCARTGCPHPVVRGPGRPRREFEARKFHSRECAHAPGGQARIGAQPSGSLPLAVPVRARTRRPAPAPAPSVPVVDRGPRETWRPEGWPAEPLTYPGARR